MAKNSPLNTINNTFNSKPNPNTINVNQTKPTSTPIN